MAGQPKNTGFPLKREVPAAGFSFWETRGWLDDLDAVVVGGGLVGMSAALRLRVKRPSWRIAVLDRASLGGATTRNAGFACFGSPSELLEDWRVMGPQATAELVKMRWQGLRLLRETWGDEALGYRPSGSMEAFTNPELYEACRKAVPELNKALEPILGKAPFLELPSCPGMNNLAGALGSPLEGDLDTGKLARVMDDALRIAQIPRLAGLAVQNLSPHNGMWHLETNLGVVQAPRVLVATNAWAASLLDVDVSPVDNHVLVSHPLPNLALQHTVHHDHGYVYAREVDGRVLIGGGRHWDCASDDERVTKLTEWARSHIQGAEAFEAAHRWVGQLGIGSNRQPIVRTVEPGLVAGVRMGGMGVAIGTQVGQNLADLL
jgi:gamma-glutamylputrescine oxidase